MVKISQDWVWTSPDDLYYLKFCRTYVPYDYTKIDIINNITKTKPVERFEEIVYIPWIAVTQQYPDYRTCIRWRRIKIDKEDWKEDLTHCREKSDGTRYLYYVIYREMEVSKTGKAILFGEYNAETEWSNLIKDFDNKIDIKELIKYRKL